ncbi:O-antigen ligase family protein [uncultured Hymenobacter sp.]|uniref:O-antigen ligase family protein n=1 Tax=uncultured Hymenobacter sp. TaxID=170016 RepID=UPI0035CB2F4D
MSNPFRRPAAESPVGSQRQTGSLQALYHCGRLSQYLLWLACGAGVVGLLGSRALIALSPVVGVGAVLLNPNLRAGLRHYARNGAARRAALLYALLLVSALYTTDWAEWRHEIYRWLPWLAVPLAFTAAVPLSARQRLAVGSLFVLGTALVGIGTLGQYLLNPAAANEAFRVSQNLPSSMGVSHIPFSVMLVLAGFGGLYLRREPLAGPGLRGALATAGGVGIVIVHVLAYRTGLLVFYGALAAEALRLLFRRRLRLGLALLLLMAGAATVAYQTLEPVRRRVGVTLYDVDQFQQGRDINQYSLSRRLAAWETAALLARQHPWLGVGLADAKAAMMGQYNWRDYGVRPQNRVMIHNQYLHFLVGSGVLGLGLWLLLLSRPLLQPAPRRNPYIRSFLLVMAAAMLVDSLLQVQIGYNLFVFGYGFLVVAAERHQQFSQSLPPRPA